MKYIVLFLYLKKIKNEKTNYIINKNITLFKCFFLDFFISIIFIIINFKNYLTMNKKNINFLILLIKIFAVYAVCYITMFYLIFVRQ